MDAIVHIKRLAHLSTLRRDEIRRQRLRGGKPPAGAPELIGKPTPENPGSLDLKLGDPFGSPGAGQ